VRAALLFALLVLLLPQRQGALARTPAPKSASKAAAHRKPWLFFPIDVRRFDRVSSKYGVRRMKGHKELHRGVDLVAPAGSWVVAAREGRVADVGHARAHLWAVAAVLCGALVACFASALVAPLALAGGVRVQQAAALFRADLETYRAAPEDLRASPLVCVAAAGYEDRKLFDRPRWVPPLSPTGLARAVARNLRGIPEGGSTIPQQIAKLYLRSARRGTVGDKIREALFATWLVRQATPMELAGLYLNLGAGASIGGDRRPADGLDRLSLALFGLPLRRLSREDQLGPPRRPRGVRWLHAAPA